MKTSEEVEQKLQEKSLMELLTDAVDIDDDNNDVCYAFWYAYDGAGDIQIGFCNYITNDDPSWRSAFEQQSGKIIGYFSADEIEFADPETEIIETLRCWEEEGRI